MQARLAYRCALVLRDLIGPYLLRRQKKDLKDIIRLTAKTEQVRYECVVNVSPDVSIPAKSSMRRSFAYHRGIGICSRR